mmetsp:Transcript_62/g.263  ORF Transcript_62/g.263 Transcript_62/m.263 type:complete len:202 (+) Transcript_62:457-1062(+)
MDWERPGSSVRLLRAHGTHLHGYLQVLAGASAGGGLVRIRSVRPSGQPWAVGLNRRFDRIYRHRLGRLRLRPRAGVSHTYANPHAILPARRRWRRDAAGARSLPGVSAAAIIAGSAWADDGQRRATLRSRGRGRQKDLGRGEAEHQRVFRRAEYRHLHPAACRDPGQGRGVPALEEALHAAAQGRRAVPQPWRGGTRGVLG